MQCSYLDNTRRETFLQSDSIFAKNWKLDFDVGHQPIKGSGNGREFSVVSTHTLVNMG